MGKSSTASGRHGWLSRTGASTTTPNARTRHWDTGHQHLSPSHQNQPHSTRRHSCNNLSYRLVQNIGQANRMIAPDPVTTALSTMAIRTRSGAGVMRLGQKLSVQFVYEIVEMDHSRIRILPKTSRVALDINK